MQQPILVDPSAAGALTIASGHLPEFAVAVKQMEVPETFISKRASKKEMKNKAVHDRIQDMIKTDLSIF